MWFKYPLKLLKYAVFSALLAFVGIIAFCYFSDDYSAYIVLSDSMEPGISSGDLVIVGSPGSPLAGDVGPGSIVTYRHDDKLVTHRVVSVEGDSLVTRGDAVEEPDPWPVSRFYDVMGCYIFHVPGIGTVTGFIGTKLGWFLAIILPAVLLLALIIKEIIKEAFRSDPVTN